MRAEPHLAVRAGLSCASCHVNRTGGGGRTAYGTSFGAGQLPAPARSERGMPFDGALHARVRIGADARAAYIGHFRGESAYVGEYDLIELNAYLAVEVLERVGCRRPARREAPERGDAGAHRASSSSARRCCWKSSA